MTDDFDWRNRAACREHENPDLWFPSENEEVLRLVGTTDLMDYGFESEFVGRLPVVAQLQELSEEALCDVLKSPYSAVVQGKKSDFAAYGIELEFDDDALREIARRAHTAGIGARGLTSVMERALVRFEKLLPSSTVKKLPVTRELIGNPEATAAELLTHDAVAQFQRKFLERSGLILEFPPETVAWVREHLGHNPADIVERLCCMFENYEYGMKLAGLPNLRVTVDVISKPERYLDRVVKAAYIEKKPDA